MPFLPLRKSSPSIPPSFSIGLMRGQLFSHFTTIALLLLTLQGSLGATLTPNGHDCRRGSACQSGHCLIPFIPFFSTCFTPGKGLLKNTFPCLHSSNCASAACKQLKCVDPSAGVVTCSTNNDCGEVNSNCVKGICHSSASIGSGSSSITAATSAGKPSPSSLSSSSSSPSSMSSSSTVSHTTSSTLAIPSPTTSPASSLSSFSEITPGQINEAQRQFIINALGLDDTWIQSITAAGLPLSSIEETQSHTSALILGTDGQSLNTNTQKLSKKRTYTYPYPVLQSRSSCGVSCLSAGYDLQPRPGYNPTTNGCGPISSVVFTGFLNILAPQFLKACNGHDRCYGECSMPAIISKIVQTRLIVLRTPFILLGTCNSNRDACNNVFFKDMAAACNSDLFSGIRDEDCRHKDNSYIPTNGLPDFKDPIGIRPYDPNNSSDFRICQLLAQASCSSLAIRFADAVKRFGCGPYADGQKQACICQSSGCSYSKSYMVDESARQDLNDTVCSAPDCASGQDYGGGICSDCSAKCGPTYGKSLQSCLDQSTSCLQQDCSDICPKDPYSRPSSDCDACTGKCHKIFSTCIRPAIQTSCDCHTACVAKIVTCQKEPDL